MGTFADNRRRCDDVAYEPNVGRPQTGKRRGEPMARVRARPRGDSGCRWSACCAGLLLAATHGVSGGRRDPAQRRPAAGRPRPGGPAVGGPAQRPARRARRRQIDTHHGGTPGCRRRADGDHRTRDAAGRRRRPGPDARPGPGRHAQRRAARRRGPVPRATRPPTIWWCTSRTSRRSSTRCGAPAPRASRCRISGSSARPRRGASATPCCSTGAPTARPT